MEEQELEFKKIMRIGVIVAMILICGVTLYMSFQDVNPGEEGFIYRPYGAGVDRENVFTEGTQLIAPWNEMITYNVRQQSKSYTSKVMDKNGTDIEVTVAVNFAAQKGKTPDLHLKHGPGYITFIDDKSKGAIKDVIGRYTYEEVYSTKREDLEGEIEEILKSDFAGKGQGENGKDVPNYVVLHYVEIADINLPGNIAVEITNKETQKQKNLTAKEKQKQEEYLANARIEKARGDSSLVVSARFKAEAIQLEAEQISKNPVYIELKKWENWDGKGSPFGTGNVFGDNAISILKQ